MSANPSGWARATFDQLFDFKGGSQPPKSTFSDHLRPGYVRLLQIRDFESDAKAVFIKDDPRWPKCSANDIMIGRYGASVGKILTGKAGAYNVALVRMIFDRNVLDASWVRLFLLSSHFQEPLNKISRSAQNGFNKTDLEKIEVPLPPLAEQSRFVAKIDSLSAKSKRARDQLDHIARLVEKYKQAILTVAFRDHWKDENTTTLGDCSEFVTSGSRGWAKFYSEEGARFIRVGNVQRADITLDWSDMQRVAPPDGSEGQRTSVRPNDLVITITADLGRVGLIPSDLEPAYVNQHVALVRLKAPENAAFIAWYLASDIGQEQLVERNRGATRAGLGLDDIRAVRIPVVSFAAQQVTINRVETAYAWVDRIASETTSARKLIDHLDQAISAKAFRGELIPQDPNDEPASVLLERIRAERAAPHLQPSR